MLLEERSYDRTRATQQELQGVRQGHCVEQSHRVDVWQLSVDVRHRTSDTDDGSLHEVQVREQHEQQHRSRLFPLTRGDLIVETHRAGLFLAVLYQ